MVVFGRHPRGVDSQLRLAQHLVRSALSARRTARGYLSYPQIDRSRSFSRCETEPPTLDEETSRCGATNPLCRCRGTWMGRGCENGVRSRLNSRSPARICRCIAFFSALHSLRELRAILPNPCHHSRVGRTWPGRTYDTQNGLSRRLLLRVL